MSPAEVRALRDSALERRVAFLFGEGPFGPWRIRLRQPWPLPELDWPTWRVRRRPFDWRWDG